MEEKPFRFCRLLYRHIRSRCGGGLWRVHREVRGAPVQGRQAGLAERLERLPPALAGGLGPALD